MEKKPQNVASSDFNGVEQLNEGQKKALALMLTGADVFLTGEAGTGKTHLINTFVKESVDKNIVVCAPTGRAALQVNGMTVHRLFGLKAEMFSPDQPVKNINKIIIEAETIIIEEISMCRLDLFDYVMRYIETAETLDGRKKQVIVVGDFFQLPPVLLPCDKAVFKEAWQPMVGNSADKGYAFLTPQWAKRRFISVVLHEPMRQKDKLFLAHLNEIRRGNCEAIDWINAYSSKEENKGIYLCARNWEVSQKNEAGLKRLNQMTEKYFAVDQNFRSEVPADRVLELCPGARVMTLVNHIKGLYQNGSLGYVTRLNPCSVEICLDNGREVEIGRYTWQNYTYKVEMINNKRKIKKYPSGTYTQFPLKVAYAITIHKAQGQTFDRINLNPSCFAEGQLYVALSRVSSVEGLHIVNPIQKKDIKVSKTVCDFMERIDNK